MYMRLGVWRIGGIWGYNFVKNVDLFFLKNIPPFHGGMGVYFQSNKGEEAVLEYQFRPRVVLDIQVWLPVRDGDGRSHFLAEPLCLIPEESAGQRLWERLERLSNIRNNQEWCQRRLPGRVFTKPFSTRPYDLKRVSLGISVLEWLPHLI